MKKIIWLFALLFYLQSSGQKYVTNTGIGTTCSQGSPCSLTYAFANAVAGDVVYVKAGNYGALQLSTSHAGTSGSPIKFIGYTTTPGDITASGGPSYSYANWLANSSDLPDNVMPHLELNPTNDTPGTGQNAFSINHSYVEIHNFMVSEYYEGFDITADHVTLNNVIGDQFGGWDPSESGWNASSDSFSYSTAFRSGYGIHLASADYTTLTNCMIIDAGFVAYFIVGSNFNTVTDCWGISERPGNGSDYIFDMYNSNDNVLTNIVSRRTYGGSIGHRSRAMSTQGTSGSSRNTITNLTTYNARIQCEYSDDNVYTNVNMSVINGAGGENDGSFQIGPDSNNNVFKNVSMTGGGGIAFLGYNSGDGGATVTTAGANNYFINFKISNLSAYNGNGLVSFHRLGNSGVTSGPNYVVNMTADDFPWIINANRDGNIQFYNCSFSGGSQTSIDTYYSGFSDFTGSYTAGYNHCNFYNNSFSTPTGTSITTGNPLLDGNLAPTSGSALIDAGMDASTLNINANTDYLGNARGVNGTDDIGAYEYGSSPTPTCSDGIQNGDETGVDCGGSCSPCSSPGTSTGAGARAFMNYLLTN